MKKILFFLTVLFSSQAFAVEWKKDSDFLWNASTGKIDVFPGSGSGQIWSAAELKPSAFGPTLQRQKALPFNPSPRADFKSTFKPSAIAKGLLNPTSALITLAGAAIIQEALENACVRVMGGSMEIAPGAQWEECKYKEEISGVYTAGLNSFPKVGKASTPGAACSSAASQNSFTSSTAYNTTSRTYAVISSSPTSCMLQSTTVFTPIPGVPSTSTGSVFNAGMLFSSVKTEVFDGYKPATLAAAEAKVKPVLDAWTQSDFLYGFSPDNKASQVVDAIMKSGNGIEPDIKVTGPASSPTTTTSTVNSNGTTTTKNTTNNYQYTTNSPVSSTVTVTTVTTTNVTNTTTGEVTETTSTTEEGKDTEDPCIKNPERVGCAKLGDVPETQQIPKLDVPITFTPTIFASPAGCPAAHTGVITVGAFSKAWTISYDPLCEVMVNLRLLFLAIGAAAAAWLFMEGLKI